MKKNKLEIDYGFDFRLLGLICALKPHKLAWTLNGALNLDLARQEDHLIQEKDGVATRFICFLHRTDVTTLRLFKNKSADDGASKWLLVPEHPHFDYILFIQSGEQGRKQK